MRKGSFPLGESFFILKFSDLFFSVYGNVPLSYDGAPLYEGYPQDNNSPPDMTGGRTFARFAPGKDHKNRLGSYRPGRFLFVGGSENHSD